MLEDNQPVKLSEISPEKKSRPKRVRALADESDQLTRPKRKTKKTGYRPRKAVTSSDPEGLAQDQESVLAGKITMIEAQKRHKKRYNVYLDGDFVFGISEDTLVRYALSKGQYLSQEESKNILASERDNRAYQIALNYLSHSLRSKKQVSQRLAKEDYSQATIDKVMAKLEDLSLVNDLYYGQSYTRTAKTINRKGPKVIAMELKEKGLSEDIIDQALLEYSEADQMENAQHLAKKKLPSLLRKNSNLKAVEKLQQFLYKKGYNNDLISQVLSQLKESDQLDRDEGAALNKYFKRYWKKYRNLDEKERRFKVKTMLFGRGFKSEAIDAAIRQAEEEGELWAEVIKIFPLRIGSVNQPLLI